MLCESVNYDSIASTYNRRYTINPLPGIAATLESLVGLYRQARILEVGCGTGRWPTELQPIAPQMYGLDLSPGMLGQARDQQANLKLLCGHACQLPFPDASFHLVFCVNALHHFDHPRSFISEACRLLTPGGTLAIIGMDPHAGRDEWYVYQYFMGTYEMDLARFPAGDTILAWMRAAGFDGVVQRLAEHILQPQVGRDVLQSHFLQKHGTSQLTLLTDEAYAAGLGRIEAALNKAEAAAERLVFPVDISLMLFTGRVPFI
jgi:ubiquinone/menaquinone biosynthesis C-methylase UbiE